MLPDRLALTEWLSDERNQEGANNRHLQLLEELHSVTELPHPLFPLALELMAEADYSNLWRTILRGVRGYTQLTETLAELSRQVLLLILLFADSTNPEVLLVPFLEVLTDDFWGASIPHRTPESYDEQWLNLNTFVAHLLIQRGLRAIQGAASYTLVEALEKHPWTDFPLLEKEKGPMDSDLRSFADSSTASSKGSFPPNTSLPESSNTSIAEPGKVLELGNAVLLNHTVPAAAMWIKKAGKRLYELTGDMDYDICFEVSEDWQRSDFGGELGWSKERYRFWKKRFEIISNLDVAGVTQLTKDLAKEAAETMDNIESNNRS